MKARVGANIRAARKKRNMSQVELARALGVSSSTVCDWEKGRSYPSIENLRAIAATTKESLSFLGADFLPGRNTLEAAAKQLGARLGHRLVDALLSMPEARLRREVASIVGEFYAEGGRIDSRSNG